MNKQISVMATVVIALIAIAGGFIGGMTYQQSTTKNSNTQFQGGGAGGRGNGGLGRRNGQAVRGQVLSEDDKSATVQLSDGSSKLVLYTSTTMFGKATQASKSDVKTGDMIQIFGTNNSDGSVTAQNVQLNPQQFRPNASSSPVPAQ